MTEEQSDKAGTQTESQPQQQEQKPAAPPRAASGGKALGITALLVAIAAAGVAGYLWYQVQVEQRLSQSERLSDIRSSLDGAVAEVRDTVSETRVSVTALEKEVESLRNRQDELTARVDNQVSARLQELAAAQQNLSQRAEDLSASVEKVYEDLDRSLDSWALEEVEQLLRIANHSLQLSRDVSTAIAGLELADQRLEELANPAYIPVRERLAENITALKNIETVDVAGLTLRLSNMAEKVSDLPLAQTTERPITGDGGSGGEGDAGSASSNEWLQAGRELVDDLSRLVRIQNIEQAPQPLLTPEQRYFLFGNLRLMLSGAQIAALRGDTATFRANLERASQWLGEYYDTSHDGVQQMISDIEGMSGAELSPELPDISDSLNALRQVKRRMGTQ